MTIAKAEVAFRGRDETAMALRNIVRNTESAQKQIATKLRAAFNFVGVGAAIYGITRAVSGAIQAGDDLAKFAEKSGMAAEAASELAHAARMSDIDLGTFATGVKKMQVALSQAGSGVKAPVAALKALGLTFEDLQVLSPDRQLELIADQISRLKDPADRTRAAVELFGRAGADLLPMFEQGAAGIRAARTEAQQMGKSFSEDDLRRFQEADDAFKRLSQSGSALADTLALKLEPAVTTLADRFRILIGGGSDRENLIAETERRLKALAGAAAAFNSDEIERLTEKLEILMNPKSDPLSGRGRVFKSGPEASGFAAAAGAVREISQALVTAQRIVPGFSNIYSEMLQSTATDAQKAARAYEAFKVQLQELLASGLIDGAEFNKRLGAYLDENLKDVEVTAERLIVAKEKADNLFSTLKDESARQAFTAISDVIYNMGDGMDDFAQSALDAFRRILANTLTQQLFSLLGGIGGGGSAGGFAGFIGSLFSGFTSAPHRAGGGPVSSGRPYMVGEQGPELFVPGSSGAIVPKGAMGGGGCVITVNAPLNMDARGASMDLAEAMPGILERHGQMIESRVIEGIRRGRYRLSPV